MNNKTDDLEMIVADYAQMSGSPKVSVNMLAYNHDLYIAEAIESILAQRTDFPIRLVIGEDCSTDNTRSICEAYANQYPEKILLLPSEYNLGIQKNFLRTLQVCAQSKYVAFCEGDDKWTDPYKLQSQVEFLESNEKFCAHAHNVNSKDLRTGHEELFGGSEDRILDAKDLFKSWDFHVVSLIVKSDVINKIPINELPQFISCDRFLNMWIGCHGNIFYEGSKNYAIYHVHGQGASANSNYLQVKLENYNLVSYLKKYINDNDIDVYKESLSTAIEQYFYLLALQDKSNTINRYKFILDYFYSKKIQSKSDFYLYLLILFGNRFFKLHSRLFKKNHINN